jgi:hypothetical protein
VVTGYVSPWSHFRGALQSFQVAAGQGDDAFHFGKAANSRASDFHL